jgi:hypothetical protein
MACVDLGSSSGKRRCVACRGAYVPRRRSVPFHGRADHTAYVATSRMTAGPLELSHRVCRPSERRPILLLRFGGVTLIALLAAACSAGSTGATTSAAATGSFTLSGALSGTYAQSAALGCSAMTSPSPGPTRLSGAVNFGDLRLRFLGFPGRNKLPLGGEGLGLVSISTASSSWSAGQDRPTSLGTLTLSQRAGHVIQGSIDATLISDYGSTQTLHITGYWSCRS